MRLQIRHLQPLMNLIIATPNYSQPLWRSHAI